MATAPHQIDPEWWTDVLDGLFPQDAAKRILSELTHYRHGGRYEDEDIRKLAAALIAFVGVA